ncbi:MAG: DUF933 domain-containing protein [Vulcanimicrobiota bacterium]
MNIGIIGLGQAGKSTLFSSFTGKEPSAPGTGGDTGIVNIPDARLDKLHQLYNAPRKVYATAVFEDFPPLDTQIKQQRINLVDRLRVMDALVLVVGAYRCMSELAIIDELNKLRFELIMNDLDFVTKRIERLDRDMRVNAKNRLEKEKEMTFLQKLQTLLEQENIVARLDLDPGEQAMANNYNLTTDKPTCYVFNISESMEEQKIQKIIEQSEKILKETGDSSPILVIDASLEAEVAQMDPEEVDDFLAEFGISKLGRDKIIKATYNLLDQITFFTVGDDENRAWTIKKGSSALEAAETIHTDLARGFIKAEVVKTEDLLELGSMNEVKKAGRMRLEGKNYQVQDGEIVHINFNV